MYWLFVWADGDWRFYAVSRDLCLLEQLQSWAVPVETPSHIIGW